MNVLLTVVVHIFVVTSTTLDTGFHENVGYAYLIFNRNALQFSIIASTQNSSMLDIIRLTQTHIRITFSRHFRQGFLYDDQRESSFDRSLASGYVHFECY